MFSTIPILNPATNEAETRIIQVSQIEQIAPHGDISLNDMDTPCSELTLQSGRTLLVLLPFSSLTGLLGSLTGGVDELGQLI